MKKLFSVCGCILILFFMLTAFNMPGEENVEYKVQIQKLEQQISDLKKDPLSLIPLRTKMRIQPEIDRLEQEQFELKKKISFHVSIVSVRIQKMHGYWRDDPDPKNEKCYLILYFKDQLLRKGEIKSNCEWIFESDEICNADPEDLSKNILKFRAGPGPDSQERMMTNITIPSRRQFTEGIHIIPEWMFKKHEGEKCFEFEYPIKKDNCENEMDWIKVGKFKKTNGSGVFSFFQKNYTEKGFEVKITLKVTFFEPEKRK